MKPIPIELIEKSLIRNRMLNHSFLEIQPYKVICYTYYLDSLSIRAQIHFMLTFKDYLWLNDIKIIIIIYYWSQYCNEQLDINEAISKSIKTEACIYQDKWTMKEALIFFKIVFLAFKIIPVSFFISWNSYKISLLMCYQVVSFYLLMSSMFSNLRWILSLGNKKNLHREWFGEYGGCCTIQCFSKTFGLKNNEIGHVIFFKMALTC